MPRKKRSQTRKGFSVWKHRGKWFVGFALGNKRHQVPLGIDGDAPREDAEAEASRRVGQVRDEFLGTETAKHLNAIEEHAKSIECRSRSHQINCARAAARFRAFFKDKAINVCDLEREDVARWRQWLLTEAPVYDRRHRIVRYGVAPMVAAFHIGWLSSVCKVAGVPSPTVGVRRPRKTHDEAVRSLMSFRPEEVPKLLDAARAEVAVGNKRHFYNALVVLVYTGIRAGELAELKPSDLDHTQQILYVTGKGRKRRPLRLIGPMQAAWDALLNEMAAHPNRPTIFHPVKNWPWRNVDRLSRKVLGRPATAHQCRHTFASLALQYFQPNWDIAFLAKWLGHAEIGITYQIYAHWLAPAPPSGPDFIRG